MKPLTSRQALLFFSLTSVVNFILAVLLFWHSYQDFNTYPSVLFTHQEYVASGITEAIWGLLFLIASSIGLSKGWTFSAKTGPQTISIRDGVILVVFGLPAFMVVLGAMFWLYFSLNPVR